MSKMTNDAAFHPIEDAERTLHAYNLFKFSSIKILCAVLMSSFESYKTVAALGNCFISII